MKSKVEAFYDKEAPAYDEEYEKDPFYTRIYKPITWDNIKRFLPPEGGLILDAGGGTGHWAIPLARLGYYVVLTDISQGMLDVALRKVEAEGLTDRVEIMRLDICDMSPLPDEHFDLVMAQGDPISYCGDPEAAVREMTRVAKRGAYVIASVDSRFQVIHYMRELDFDSAEAFLEDGEDEWPAEDPSLRFPFHAFTVSELKALFERNGLRVVRVLGKPVFFHRLPEEVRKAVLSDEEALKRLLEIEMKYADDPGWAGSGGHIEIVGIKEGWKDA